jgi:hypothetical protein
VWFAYLEKIQIEREREKKKFKEEKQIVVPNMCKVEINGAEMSCCGDR